MTSQTLGCDVTAGSGRRSLAVALFNGPNESWLRSEIAPRCVESVCFGTTMRGHLHRKSPAFVTGSLVVSDIALDDPLVRGRESGDVLRLTAGAGQEV